MEPVFNFGLPAGQVGQTTGQGDLNAAKGTLQAPENYFRSLLTAGRTETAASSAPAVNTALAQSDAARRTEATMGTGRGGGTAAANREASTTTGAGIDQIINQNMVGGRAAGASAPRPRRLEQSAWRTAAGRTARWVRSGRR